VNETSPFFALTDVSYSIIGLCALTTVAYKLWAWRGELRNGVLWTLCVMIASPAAAFLLATPYLYRRVDALCATASLCSLLLYGAVGVGFTGAFRCWARIFAHPAEPLARLGARGIAAQCAVIAAALAALFALGHHPYERPIDFDLYYARDPATAAMVLLFNLVFAHGLITSARRTARASRAPVTAAQRRSLRLVSLGAAVTCGYVLGSLAALAGRWGGIDLDGARLVFAPAAASAGALLILSGSSGPTLARRASAARTWARYVHGYWTLRALWARLDAVVAVPGAQGTVDRGRVALRETTHRLYRRTTAMRDAQAIAAGTIDRALARRVAQRARRDKLNDQQTNLALHAAALADVLRVLESPGAIRAQGAQHAELPVPPGVRDLDGELRWQLQLSRALRSRLVAEVLADPRARIGRIAAA
jgi:hypothetical protein